MVICAACEKAIRRNSYSWTMGWSKSLDYGGPGKKSFEVRFHNKPECISVMTERMEGYAFDQRMASAFEGIDWGFGDESELVTYTDIKED